MSDQQSPFVIGVLADLSGAPSTPLPKFRDRRFVTVTRDSISQFLAHVKPRLTPAVRSEMAPDGVRKLELTFGSLEDFQVVSVARRLQQLNALEPAAAQALARSLAQDEAFQALHSNWAGLKYLADSLTKTPNVKVKVLDVSKRELLRDLQRAAAFDQSALYRMVFSQAIGTFGGEAFGCLIGDYYFSGGPEDTELLEKISQVAAAAGAPFLSSVRPDLLGVPGWKGVGSGFSPPADAPRIAWWWRGDEWAEDWAALLFLPKFRPTAEVQPAIEPSPPESSAKHLEYPWLNPAFVVGGVIANAFSGGTSTEIVRRLFPQWNNPALVKPSAEAESEGIRQHHGDASKGFALEFECGFSTEAENKLREFGLNALSESRLARRDVLQGLVAAAPAGSELTRPGLAQVLLCCTVWNRLRDYLRMKQSTGSSADLLKTVRAWLDAISFDPLTGQRLLPFDRVSVDWDQSDIRVDLTLLPEVCGAGSTNEFAFRLHQEL